MGNHLTFGQQPRGQDAKAQRIFPQQQISWWLLIVLPLPALQLLMRRAPTAALPSYYLGGWLTLHYVAGELNSVSCHRIFCHWKLEYAYVSSFLFIFKFQGQVVLPGQPYKSLFFLNLPFFILILHKQHFEHSCWIVAQIKELLNRV